MCDFPNAEKQGVSSCATQAEVDSGLYLSQSTAATSLATSQKNALTLDWSPAALNECMGLPKKVQFLGGEFPDGQQVCIDAAQQFPNVYANPTKACIARCEDVIAKGPGPFPADIHDYCVNNAHTSTNFDKNSWYPNSCTSGGTPVPNFVDPRRTPEKVKWTDLNGATDNGGTNSITQTAPTTGSTIDDYKSGAASQQTILSGDAWVEFEVTALNQGMLLSLRPSCADPATCPDADPSVWDLGYALVMFTDGQVWVNEYTANPVAVGPFGAYSVGERYRVRAVDNHNGEATISYSRLLGPCAEGTQCAEQVLYTSLTPAAYPLRVDASMRVQGSTFANVTLVRIQQ
jgi:hypothetical protein